MANRLADESSPYLQQHADNPVDWYPWGEEALAAARNSQKPILLSVGYSSCHWCHVMAHESFEDRETARVMNEHFVNVKVDREERPDLDKIYQMSLNLLTQQTGGWPLTMFLDPDTLTPFFGGTYFPKTPRHQLPGFVDLLLRIHGVFAEQRDDLAKQGEKVRDVLKGLNHSAAEAQMGDHDLIDTAHRQLAEQYDSVDGGFGNAPKFPMPNTVRFVLERWARTGHEGEPDRKALDFVMTTLTRMARGGIRDHLGGGFCRYSTDRKWMVPHFEKMLYDNGQLMSLYAQVLSIGPDELFSEALRETVGWLLRDMRHVPGGNSDAKNSDEKGGGFYAALDADSEGEEGLYYVWRREEVKKLLTEEEYLVVETLYGLDKPANFERKWNLHRYDSWRAVVGRLSMQRPAADEVLASAKAKMLAVREERPRPGLDNKILVAWNGLAIQGLAEAGAVLSEPKWIDAAQEATDFIREGCWNGKRLAATWDSKHTEDNPRLPGYLDDYANMLNGLLANLSARWREADASFAVALAERLVTDFADEEDGGFFFTAHHHEQLIHRPKPTLDDATPPGNGTAAIALGRLGHLFGRADWLTHASRALLWARQAMEQYPAGHATLLTALTDELTPPQLVILRGPKEAIGDATDRSNPWQQVARTGYQPWRQVFAIPYEDTRTLPPFLPSLVSADKRNKVTAYVCTGTTCSLPMDTTEALKAALAGE